MNKVGLTLERLQQLVSDFPKARIGVLGDFFLDKYLEVSPELAEPSVETGKIAHQVTEVRCSPGAAGTVVCNLQALGTGSIYALGFRGDDGEGYDLNKELHRLGCDTTHLHQTDLRATPTYLKPRDTTVAGLAGEHSRYDTKNRSVTPAEIEDLIIRSIHEMFNQLDSLIVLDQVEEKNCGVVTRRVRQAVSELAATRERPIFWADSRCQIQDFTHLIIKPNEYEAAGIEKPLPDTVVDNDELLEAAQKLHTRNQAPVVITRGSQGMLVSNPDWTAVPGVHIEGAIDPTGAGDSATAGTVLALCAGATLPEAALIGNLVASITIQQLSTTGVARPDQLADRLKMWQQQQ